MIDTMVYELHSLEGTYTCSVLLALYENKLCPGEDEELCSKDLEGILETGFQSIKTAVDQLVQNGYVYREKLQGHNKVLILLTEKGLATAKHLKELEQELVVIRSA